MWPCNGPRVTRGETARSTSQGTDWSSFIKKSGGNIDRGPAPRWESRHELLSVEEAGCCHISLDTHACRLAARDRYRLLCPSFHRMPWSPTCLPSMKCRGYRGAPTPSLNPGSIMRVKHTPVDQGDDSGSCVRNRPVREWNPARKHPTAHWREAKASGS